MTHKNYGGIGHTNTGYNNHNNTGGYSQSGGYAQSGYSNGHYQAYGDYHQSYHNHSNYTKHDQYSECANRQIYKSPNRIKNKKKFNLNIQLFRIINYNRHSNSGYANNHTQNYRDYHQSYHNHTNYYNHTNYGNHTNTGGNGHNNTGYTNHVNTNTNVAPGNVSNVSKGAAIYYKDSAQLSWTAAVDNNKVISVVSRNTGAGGHGDNGIWENTVKKQEAVRSWAAAYWEPNGTFGGSIGCDVYGNASQGPVFENWLRNVHDNYPNRIVAILGFDEPYTNATGIINLLKSWGYSSLNNADGSHFVFVGIQKNHVGILAQQTVRRYGTGDVRSASCSYIMEGVNSGQTISYYIDYAFKPIGGTYGEWTRIGTTTANNYSYNLSEHTNGHIKFRVLSTDGVENGSAWVESDEVRVLKYTAPSSWGTQEKITASDFESLKIEINKLAGAVGTESATGDTTQGNLVTKAMITDFRNKIKLIAPEISKTAPTDSNLDIIRKADIDNLKNWLKEV